MLCEICCKKGPKLQTLLLLLPGDTWDSNHPAMPTNQPIQPTQGLKLLHLRSEPQEVELQGWRLIPEFALALSIFIVLPPWPIPSHDQQQNRETSYTDLY